MDDIVTTPEMDGVFFGEQSGYISSVIEKLKSFFGMRFAAARDVNELVRSCFTLEPLFIVSEIGRGAEEAFKRISYLRKIGMSVCIGLADSSVKKSKKPQLPKLSGVVVKSGDSLCDAMEMIRLIKLFISNGVFASEEPGNAPIVTELNWHSSTKEFDNMREFISDRLEQVGIRRELLGHKYLIDAIAVQSTVGGAPEPIELYRQIAGDHGTTPAAVEKAIRYAVERAWTSGDIGAQHELFGNSVDPERGKPTNAEFIARLALEI